MRIRKRFLSLSAAITAPPPSSDPHAGDHQLPPLLLVQQQQVHPNGNLRALYDNPQSHPFDPPLNRRPSSDHTTQIGFQTTSTPVSSGAGSEAKRIIVSPHKELESEEKEAIKTDDSGRKCGEASRHVNTGSLSSPPTTAHNLVLKGWLEGDRLIPIKKRRGSFGKGACNNKNHDLEDDNNEMMIEGTLMKPKSNLKKNGNKIRGNVIMEGSRCSRVNGRGWRCCQQTLVGYSLCEHHLGKGRLRSMNSVRNRAQKVALKQEEEDKGDEIVSMGEPHDFEDDDKDWVDESVSCMNKCSNYNKKKIGVVKARSLSSLLSQIGS